MGPLQLVPAAPPETVTLRLRVRRASPLPCIAFGSREIRGPGYDEISVRLTTNEGGTIRSKKSMLGSRAKLALLLAVATLPTVAQNYQGAVVPRDSTPRSAKAIDFFVLEFQSQAWGREGPSLIAIETPPVKGREYFVEAEVSGIDAIASLRFDLTDEAGGSVTTPAMWKADDSESEGDFYGLVTVPSHPFRFVVSGSDRQGTPFRRAFPEVFRPVDTSEERPLLPAGLDASQAARIQKFVDKMGQAMKARSTQAARDHPGGLIALMRSSLLGMTFEPFNSSDGNPLGRRLRYRIRFAADSLINAVPRVSPLYSERDWRGVVQLKPLQGNITPPPEFLGASSLADAIVAHAPASYSAGITYSFTVDMVPDYVIQGVRSGRFCLYERKFERRRDRWDAIRADTVPVSYSVAIRDLDYDADVPSFFPQGTFYESFVREGATDCGPMPNNRF